MAPEDCGNARWPMTLCRETIDSVCGNDRRLEGLCPSHHLWRACFVAEIESIMENLGTGAAMIAPKNRRKVHMPLLLRCGSIDAACGHDRGSVECGSLRCTTLPSVRHSARTAIEWIRQSTCV
jgi:hypothetical protein